MRRTEGRAVDGKLKEKRREKEGQTKEEQRESSRDRNTNLNNGNPRGVRSRPNASANGDQGFLA